MGKHIREWNIPVTSIITRMVHVIITVGIATLMLTTSTVLRKHMDNHEFVQPVLYLTCAFVSLFLYFTVACMDPGYVKRGDPDIKEIQLILDDDDDDQDDSLFEISNMNEDDWNIKMNKRNDTEKTKILENEISNNGRSSKCFNLEPHERCGLCGLQKPLRAKHCRDCKHCVRRFDHHCPWITNCVGERNHKWFYVFLVVTLFMLAWSFYISITGYNNDNKAIPWVQANILLILTDVFMAILMLIVGSLLCIHTYLMATNHTTWETMSKHRISYLKELKESVGNPFNLGVCRNMFTFFCYFHPYDWNVVYSKVKTSRSYEGSDSDSNEEFCEINVQ